MGQNPDYTLSDLNYRDLGKSGYKGEHTKDGGGFAMLLDAVKTGGIKAGDVVLVEAIDRAGRLHPLIMLNEVITPILAAGVSIITLDDNTTYTIDSAAGGHLFLLVAKIQAAHGYSKQLSERVTASYEIRRQKAISGEPVKRWTPIWLTVDGVLKETIAPNIKNAFELYVSGVGKNTIANRLRATGVPELASCSGPTIEAWLRNKAAIGYWNEIPNVYPAVVSNELFMQAQLRKKQAATKPRERTSKHFLVGLVKCGTCGSNYVIHHKDGKPNNMRCVRHHRLKSAGCTNAETVPYQVVYKMYTATAHMSIGKALNAIRLTENDKRKLALTVERDEVIASFARLAKALAKYDSPAIEAELDEANERRKAIDEELSILDRVVEQPVRRQAFDIIHDSAVEHDRMFKDDPIQLSALLRQAEYAITVHEGRTLFVTGDDVPLIYVGTVRKGNQTLGYRVLEGGHEFVISPIIPEIPTAFNHDDKSNYVVSRSGKVLSMKLAVHEVDGE
ncbi:recombinase family protein [Pseudomonas plecoglossicida]|nr:recombinase family protein [Pseudomonas plecoglossicida]